jgi:hypothetical protein
MRGKYWLLFVFYAGFLFCVFGAFAGLAWLVGAWRAVTEAGWTLSLMVGLSIFFSLILIAAEMCDARRKDRT